MRILLTSLLISAVCFSATAQKAPIKFGNVAKDEIAMTTYDADPTAPAVVLADYGHSRVLYRQNVGFTVEFERITRIKILTKEGLDHGNFEIFLFKRGSDREKIIGLKATTYNLENGKVVESKLRNDGIFEEQYDERRELVKVSCPNVREGSVVEITYKINSPYPGWMRDWSFQSTIPTVYSEYRTHYPEYYHFDRYTQGYVTLSVNEHTRAANNLRITSQERTGGRVVRTEFVTGQIDFQEHRFRWAAENVPAFKPEPYMTSHHDYISKINFQLASLHWPNRPVERIMGTWEDVNKTLSEYDSFLPVITGSNFLRRTVEEITAGISDPSEKMAAITTYVKANVLWDRRQRLFPSQSLRKVLDEKKGNSADVNFLLASMLDKAGIRVRPVILSTRDNGLLRVAAPVLSQFNYVIVLAEIDDAMYLLDATEPLLPTGVLPQRCLNGQGLAIAKEGPRWVSLESTARTRTVASVSLTLNDNGYLEGTLKLDCDGYEALRHRKRYFSEGEEKYVRDFVGSRQWEILSSKFEKAEKIGENFTGVHDLIINDNITQAGETLYLNPILISGLKENPFKSETREYPVDFGHSFDQTFSLRFKIPEGYVIDELPTAKIIALPENSARYLYNVSALDNVLSITSTLQVNKSIFTQLEYANLREFYNQVVAKQAEQIVLKRRD